MASEGGFYLPNLEQCFAGQASVISWTDVLTQVVRENINTASETALQFLASPFAARILSIPQLLARPVPILPKPSSQAKADFESKTAAINITPSPGALYSIDEIKEDTLWLSKCLDLDEIECLRIVLLEWQTRPVAHLQDGLSETEAASLRDVVGSEEYGLGQNAPNGPGKLADPAFHSEERRRSRLVALCAQEQASMFRISAVLTDIFVQIDLMTSSGIELRPERKFARTLKTTVKGTLRSLEAQQDGFLACFDGIKDCLDRLSRGPPWAGEPFNSIARQNEWTCTVLNQISALLELILLHHKSPGAHMDTNRTLAWLTMMLEVGFFHCFEPQSVGQAMLCSRIQALASTATLALLHLSEATEYFERVGAKPDIQLDVHENPSYFMDPDTTGEIHQLMKTFAASAMSPAGPALLAWGLIVGNIRAVAARARDSRDDSHVQKAIDSGGSESPADRRLSSSSIGSIQQSKWEDVMDSIRYLSHGEDDVQQLIDTAVVACDVFQFIAHLCTAEALRTPICSAVQAAIFQQLIITSIAQTEYYEAGIVATQVAVIDALADLVKDSCATSDIYALQVRLFHEQSGIREVLEVAASRFPYESSPFLQLCSSLVRLGYVNDDGQDYIASFLQHLPTFTQRTDPSFSAYHTTREDENLNLVSLDANLDMLNSSESQKLIDFQGQVTELSNTIPSGTMGIVISEGSPLVIKWLHSYSGLAFLGLWLNGFRCGQLQGIYPDHEERETTAAIIIGLLSRLLSFPHHDRSTKLEHALALLKDIASELPDDVDLASMVFDICEQKLQSLRYRKQDLQSYEIVVATLKLITTLLPLLPSRIWSSLSRSTLAATRDISSGVLAIILSIETTREDYGFLEAYADLYRAMVENAVEQAAAFDTMPVASRVASDDDHNMGGVPTRIIDGILHAATRTLMSSFQAASRWKFASSNQRTGIIIKLAQTFQSVLRYIFGVDDTPKLSTKLTAGLVSSATYIVSALRPDSEEALEPVCLLQWLLISWQLSVETWSSEMLFASSQQACVILQFIKMVLKVGMFLEKSQTATETQMLNALPVIVRLGILDKRCSSASLEVLHELIQATSSEDAASLLGRLGSVSARAFLESNLPLCHKAEKDKTSLSEGMHHLIRQSEDDKLRINVWNFFTSLITHKQQWFAITLLTGSPPKIISKKAKITDDRKQQNSLRGKAVVLEALDYLNAIDGTNLGLVATVLNFVVKSQMHWSWVTDSIQTDAKLLPSLTKFVSNLSLEDSDVLIQSQSNKIAALVVELATAQLHYARSRRDKAMIQQVAPLMRWLTFNAIDVNGYNVSLHINLRKNFSARYNACTLTNFKYTQLLERIHGEDFYYDIELARKMLSYKGVRSRRPDFDETFLQELIRVNLNLSLVDSQMLLLDSFQSFCTEHCTFFSQDLEVQKMMAIVVQNLLTANTTSPPSEQIFETLFQMRAEFALVMIRRLAEIKSRGSEFSGLLSAAWNALRFRNVTYEHAVDNDDLLYFRTTLTILLLAMQFHTHKRQQSQDRLALVSTQRDPTASIAFEVASVIVADGMKTVVSCIHDQATSSNRKGALEDDSLVDVRDVSLILAVLQTMLRLHVLPQITSQLGSGFVSSSIVQSCLLLYSWSHILAASETDKQPIYADLSLRFLVSLSSLPQVAEELAVEGVLSRISTARVTQLLRMVKGGASQFDKQPYNAALYGVWTTGILPLCLNLLHSVGRTMAGEVATFLNQFPQQLSRASRAFSHNRATSEPLTLMLANEGAVLALISHILKNYRLAGASAGVDAYDVPALEGYDDQRPAIIEDVKDMLVGRKLKVRAMATSEKEAAWQKMPDGQGNGSDKLEQAIATELANVLKCLSDDGR